MNYLSKLYPTSIAEFDARFGTRGLLETQILSRVHFGLTQDRTHYPKPDLTGSLSRALRFRSSFVAIQNGASATSFSKLRRLLMF